MKKSIYQVIASACLSLFFPLFAQAQSGSCMSVTMADSAAANTNVAVNVSVARCVSSPDPVTFEAFLNVSSSNPAVASPVNGSIRLATNGTAGAQIAAHPVSVCTSVTITFSTRLADQQITTTKTLMVCQFASDIGIAALAINQPAPAGQDSQVSVTITNQGSQLLSGNYRVDLSTEENTTNFVRYSCSTPLPTGVSSPVLPEIRPGQQAIVTIPFRFPQAGNFNLVARASVGGLEDGPATNNIRTQGVNVPLPKPLVCEVTPQTTHPGDTVTIKGNWFKKFNTADIPTVRIGGVDAQVIDVASPLQMTVSMPDLSCNAVGRVNVAVTSPAGTTTALIGPTFPAAPHITSTSAAQACPGGEMTINMSGLRAGCANPTVRLGNQALQVLNVNGNTILVQLPATFPVGPTTLTVQTTLGTDSTNLTFFPPAITGTALNRPAHSPPGTAETLTINLDHFRPGCAVTVRLEPGTTASGAPGAVGQPFNPQVLNTTGNSISVRVYQANGLGVWTVKVQTPYGTASRSVTLPGPSTLPSPRFP